MASWQTLPAEMKLAVLDLLDNVDVRALATTQRSIYPLCIPSLFTKICLRDWQAISQFLQNVPSIYLSHTRSLELSTQAHDSTTHPSQTDAVVRILTAAPRLHHLVLKLAGPLDKRVIPSFAPMNRLKTLAIANCADENLLPIERFVVSVAATIPHLEELSLDCISRSKLHVRDDERIPIYVPLVLGDSDIPDHPALGPALNLPSLLTIPSLRKLHIHGTHLGDPAWASVPVHCKLHVLDLGACCHENDAANRLCTERIMAAVGPTVDEFALTTSVQDAKFAQKGVTPLQKLRKLHISPFFPVESIVDTVANLAGSPIESLSVQCYEEDVVDTCTAMEEFLSLRVERGPLFYDCLKTIHVTVAANDFDGDDGHDDDDVDGDDDGNDDADADAKERREAVRRLQDFCNDLKLASEVGSRAAAPTSVTPIGGRCAGAPAQDAQMGMGKCCSLPCGAEKGMEGAKGMGMGMGMGGDVGVGVDGEAEVGKHLNGRARHFSAL
ncbi:F-box domain-containing protein [Pleurotus pulmonarius]